VLRDWGGVLADHERVMVPDAGIPATSPSIGNVAGNEIGNVETYETRVAYPAPVVATTAIVSKHPSWYCPCTSKVTLFVESKLSDASHTSGDGNGIVVELV
jgi:hypothetical protein